MPGVIALSFVVKCVACLMVNPDSNLSPRLQCTRTHYPGLWVSIRVHGIARQSFLLGAWACSWRRENFAASCVLLSRK